MAVHLMPSPDLHVLLLRLLMVRPGIKQCSCPALTCMLYSCAS